MILQRTRELQLVLHQRLQAMTREHLLQCNECLLHCMDQATLEGSLGASAHAVAMHRKHCRRRRACSQAPLQAAGTLHSMHSRQPMHRLRLHTMGTLMRCGRCSSPAFQMTSRSGS